MSTNSLYIILPILKVCFTRAYACLGKTWAKTFLLRQNQIITTLWKQVPKQTVRGAEGKSEIMAIPNKSKNTLDNLIDSLDAKFLDHLDSPNWQELIDKRSCNIPKSRDGSPTFSKEDRLDEDISITSLEPAPTIWNFQVHQHHDIAIFGAKSGRAQYGKG